MPKHGMSAGRVTARVVCGQVLRNGEELAALVLRTTGSTHLINFAMWYIKTPVGLRPHAWRLHIEGVE
eukprot:12882578-Prorocentrum_lima.AAC.1